MLVSTKPRSLVDDAARRTVRAPTLAVRAVERRFGRGSQDGCHHLLAGLETGWTRAPPDRAPTAGRGPGYGYREICQTRLPAGSAWGIPGASLGSWIGLDQELAVIR